jgi:flagellar hook-associated protein 2
MAINFGGLASGLDTAAIIDALIDVERQPIIRLEADKEFFTNRLNAFKEFNSRLTSFLSNVETLTSSADLQPKETALSNEDFFSATASTTAANGSYQLKALSLAQVEKLVSDAGQFGDTDTTTYKTGTLNLTVGGTLTSITIDDSNNTLAGIIQAINDADAGVSATLINDGAASNPYRLVLTADSVPDTIPDYDAGGHNDPDGSDNVLGTADDNIDIIFDASGLTEGSGSDFAPTFTLAQQAQQAHIQVDNIDIYGMTNTFTEAIAGVTLIIDNADEGAAVTNLTVSLDKAALKNKIQGFVSGYNNVIAFITEQSAFGDDKAGLLSGDSTLSMVKRRLQSLLTTRMEGNKSIATFSGLGLETQKDGSLTLDNATLSDAIKNNLDDVVRLLAGEGSGASAIAGMSSRFQEYLEDITSTTDGFLSARQKSYNDNIRRLDNDIMRLEQRLLKREETLNRQFMALETLVSTLNSQSDFLTQQIDLMKNIWSKK